MALLRSHQEPNVAIRSVLCVGEMDELTRARRRDGREKGWTGEGEILLTGPQKRGTILFPLYFQPSFFVSRLFGPSGLRPSRALGWGQWRGHHWTTGKGEGGCDHRWHCPKRVGTSVWLPALPKAQPRPQVQPATNHMCRASDATMRGQLILN